MVVLMGGYTHELSRHEDRFMRQGWTMSHPKRYVDMFPHDRV
jgi:hypothetical protein